MAKIETIRTSFYTMTETARRAHYMAYRESRFEILSKPDIDTNVDLGRARKTAKKAKAISPEIKALAKTLGISPKALIALRGEE